jgi:hypothetical protein
VVFALTISTSCSSISIGTFYGTKNHANKIHINERTIKGTENSNKIYNFEEVLYYDFKSEDHSAKDLSIKKTICVGKDCKTSKKYQLKMDNTNKIKALFDVNPGLINNKFTVITDFFLNGRRLISYSYVFYPQKCIDKTCRDIISANLVKRK